MVIQHNLAAINSNRMFGITNKKQAKKSERLSSGYKINRAADDAAGLAISEKMRRQIRGLSQATLNCQDGISLVQTADGALAEVHDMLHRGTELCVRAANGTLTDEERGYIQKELTALKDEINSISDRVTFNEIKILKGNLVPDNPGEYAAEVRGGLPSWVNVGASFNAGQLVDTVNTSLGERRGMILDFSALDSDPSKIEDLKAEDTGFYTTCCTCAAHYSINFVSGSASAPARSGHHSIYEVSVDGITSGTQLVNAIVAATGTNPNGHYTNLEANGNKLIVYDNRESFTPNTGSSVPGSNYGLAGPGVAYSVENTTNDPVYDIEIHAGVEPGQSIGIKLPSVNCYALGIAGANSLTQSSASSSIGLFKGALEYVSRERSRMGSYQNRMEHTINNLNNVVENTTAAESRIRDTDVAEDMVEFSNNSILLQAGQAMLAQANQSSQGILSLLS